MTPVQSKIPKFSDIVLIAITENLDDVRTFYEIQHYVTENFEIIYTDDLEILEQVVRKLSYLDQKYCFINGTFTVVDCTVNKTFVSWFIKFFALLSGEKFDRNESDELVLLSEYSPLDRDSLPDKVGYEVVRVYFNNKLRRTEQE